MSTRRIRHIAWIERDRFERRSMDERSATEYVERFNRACKKVAFAILCPLFPLCVWAFLTTPGAHL